VLNNELLEVIKQYSLLITLVSDALGCEAHLEIKEMSFPSSHHVNCVYK